MYSDTSPGDIISFPLLYTCNTNQLALSGTSTPHGFFERFMVISDLKLFHHDHITLDAYK